MALNPAVLSDAEHALGNLFQRIHHVTRVTREGLGPYADRLNGAVHDLEDILQLVFDYVSPVELDLRPLEWARVVESLASQMRGLCTVVEVALDACPRGVVLADGRALSRSFQLMGRALSRDLSQAASLSIAVAPTDSTDQARIALSCPGARTSGPVPDGDLAWAVAGRLIELHGGELGYASSAAGLECAVILPVRVHE